MSSDFFANIFFPPVCVACRQRIRRGVICRHCYSSIGVRDAISCGQCLVRLPGAASTNTMTKLCHPEFPFLLGAAGRYENHALKTLVHHLKFRSVRGAAQPLAALILRHIALAKMDLAEFLIMPIPLSRRRFRARGYNQAEMIARHLATMLEKNDVALPVSTDILIRAKHTAPQSGTEHVAERKENIRGAFAVKDPDAVRGKNILLIDDVATSGATFLEAALTLKAAGAQKIICLAAAKA